MNITYIFRSPGKEQSIERVFEPIMQKMSADGHCIKVSFAKSSKLWPLAMVYNMVRYAIASYCHSNRIYHITGDVQYIACWMNPKNTIMTIHDCVTLHSEHTSKWFKRLVYWLWYDKPLRRLRHITCISEATRADLVRFFPWVNKKLIVIANPVGTEFVPYSKVFNADKPIILHVGTRSNKNLERVIEALDGIHCTLNVIGKLTDEQKRLLSLHRIDYQNHFHASSQEILHAYRCADIVSFPSLFEGFGMPIIEGQAVGRPVLTSDREPMKSVAGGGALFVDPESVSSIRKGFAKLMQDRAFTENLVRLGLENARKYSSDYITTKYTELYRTIIKVQA